MQNAVSPPARPPSRREPVRVMVVDDSAVVRGLVSRWLMELPGVEVVSNQRTGRAAVEALEAADPDVIVLDIEMPEMDGLTALPLLLDKKPDLAVIMASTLTRRNAEISLKAMALGARDYIAKPESGGLGGQQEFRRELGSKVLALGRSKRTSAPAESPHRAWAKDGGEAISLRPASRVRPRVIAVGASTGGPPALTEMLKALRESAVDLPILIAQHMPATFTAIMANQLGRVAGCPAGEAGDGEAVRPGHIYVAPGGYHMRVEGSAGAVIRLDDGPPINYCRPAVDPLFESVASVYGSASLAVILTGMGHDGAVGALAIADQGGTVIAQDEASSVVWGMPGAAARAGACAAILPLGRVAEEIAKLIGGRAP